VSSDWSDPMSALQWHWGSAYVISCHGVGLWIAQRRDTRETLRAGTPMGLRDKIIADYTARPVSRDLSDQSGPWASRSAPQEGQDRNSTA
jgi:hypothetical protein